MKNLISCYTPKKYPGVEIIKCALPKDCVVKSDLAQSARRPCLSAEQEKELATSRGAEEEQTARSGRPKSTGQPQLTVARSGLSLALPIGKRQECKTAQSMITVNFGTCEKAKANDKTHSFLQTDKTQQTHIEQNKLDATVEPNYGRRRRLDKTQSSFLNIDPSAVQERHFHSVVLKKSKSNLTPHNLQGILNKDKILAQIKKRNMYLSSDVEYSMDDPQMTCLQPSKFAFNVRDLMKSPHDLKNMPYSEDAFQRAEGPRLNDSHLSYVEHMKTDQTKSKAAEVGKRNIQQSFNPSLAKIRSLIEKAKEMNREIDLRNQTKNEVVATPAFYRTVSSVVAAPLKKPVFKNPLPKEEIEEIKAKLLSKRPTKRGVRMSYLKNDRASLINVRPLQKKDAAPKPLFQAQIEFQRKRAIINEDGKTEADINMPKRTKLSILGTFAGGSNVDKDKADKKNTEDVLPISTTAYVPSASYKEVFSNILNKCLKPSFEIKGKGNKLAAFQRPLFSALKEPSAKKMSVAKMNMSTKVSEDNRINKKSKRGQTHLTSLRGNRKPGTPLHMGKTPNATSGPAPKALFSTLAKNKLSPKERLPYSFRRVHTNRFLPANRVLNRSRCGISENYKLKETRGYFKSVLGGMEKKTDNSEASKIFNRKTKSESSQTDPMNINELSHCRPKSRKIMTYVFSGKEGGIVSRSSIIEEPPKEILNGNKSTKSSGVNSGERLMGDGSTSVRKKGGNKCERSNGTIYQPLDEDIYRELLRLCAPTSKSAPQKSFQKAIDDYGKCSLNEKPCPKRSHKGLICKIAGMFNIGCGKRGDKCARVPKGCTKCGKN